MCNSYTLQYLNLVNEVNGILSPKARHRTLYGIVRLLFMWLTIKLVNTHLFSALMTQLNYIKVQIHDRFLFFAVETAVLFVSTHSSTFFIISMTFERFYSIIRPHKVASFNTIRRAKIIIISIVIISTVYSVPVLFLTTPEGNICVVYVKGMDYLAGKMYYWTDQVIGFVFPLIALLIMNSVIIHTLRKRSTLLLTRSDTQDEGQNQGHSSKMKSSEKQIIIMLLLVTFGFLILTTPTYGMSFYTALFAEVVRSPKLSAGFLLFQSIGQKTYFTNFGIYFYLYVISGHKFRSDLRKLFTSLCPCCFKKTKSSVETSVSKSISLNTVVTSS